MEQYTIIKNNNMPTRKFKLSTNKNNNNDESVLIESNLFIYNLIKMFHPLILKTGLKIDCKTWRFESINQIEKTGYTVYLTELD